MRSRHIAAAVVLCMAHPAIAEEQYFTPVVTFEASEAAIPGRSVDILGLVPGMTAQAAEGALSTLSGQGSPERQETSFHVGSRGVSVETDRFLSTLQTGTNDRITVFFVGPAAANQSFAIQRHVSYSEVLSAPSVESIAQALVAKYGSPSFSSLDYGAPSAHSPAELYWTFVAEEQVRCEKLPLASGQACPLSLTSYAPDNLQRLAVEGLFFDYAIRVRVRIHESDPTRVASFDTEVSDLARRKRAAQADAEALLGEVARVHQEMSNPVAAPTL